MRKDWFAVLLTVVAAAVVALAEEAVQRPPAASDVLTRTVSNLSSSPEPGDVAFQVAMLGAGVPGGEARVEGCAEVPKKSIRILETHPESPAVTALSSFGGPSDRIEE